MVLDGVLRKIRGRIDSLAAGESPESLKLGSGLPAGTCTMLLEALGSHLQQPPPILSADLESMPKLAVGAGLVNIFRLLDGAGLDDALSPASSADSHIAKEQLAVFGHVVREQQGPSETRLDIWRMAYKERNELVLLRVPASGSSRLALRSLLAIRQLESYLLAVVTGLQQRDDGSLYATVDLLAGSVVPRVAEIRDKTTGKNSRHPAFQLSPGKETTHDLLLLPSGVMARASVIRFLGADGHPLPGLRLADCLERGGEVEFWRATTQN